MAAMDEADKVPVTVLSRRPVVWRRLHALDATRVYQTRSWVVSFWILRPFGLRAGPDRILRIWKDDPLKPHPHAAARQEISCD